MDGVGKSKFLKLKIKINYEKEYNNINNYIYSICIDAIKFNNIW